jgi:DNA polymerase III subunit epsilon
MRNAFLINELVFFDLETTGLDPKKGHRVIEIAAITMEEGRVMQEYQSLVKTDSVITAHVSKIHGITNDMLRDQPVPSEVYPVLKEIIKDKILVAHNTKFDMAFLRHEFARLGMGINNRTICTLEMSRRRYPRLPNYKLGTVYRHLVGTNGDMLQIGDAMRKPEGSASCPQQDGKLQQHRALDDARMVAAIWLAMEGR